MTSYVRAPLNFMAHQKATVGDQKISFTSFDHLGWLKCDGRPLSRYDYAILFNVIGTAFGNGDGTTTFNLPNYQGCVPGMAGRPFFNLTENPLTYARGAYAGEQQHVLTNPEMPIHNHGTQTGTGQPSTNYERTSTNGLHNHTATETTEGAHSHTTNSQTPANHNHGGTTGPGGYAASSHEVSSLLGTQSADDTGSHTHTISADGAHVHTTDTQGAHFHTITIANNGDHFHTLSSQGGSLPHNNVQPTLFGGNMYIFSGKMTTTRVYTYGSTTGGLNTYPYATGTDLA